MGYYQFGAARRCFGYRDFRECFKYIQPGCAHGSGGPAHEPHVHDHAAGADGNRQSFLVDQRAQCARGSRWIEQHQGDELLLGTGEWPAATGYDWPGPAPANVDFGDESRNLHLPFNGQRWPDVEFEPVDPDIY